MMYTKEQVYCLPAGTKFIKIIEGKYPIITSITLNKAWETKANMLKNFEIMYNAFKENIQAFYDKVCVRRNERITRQQETLSSLPQFVLEEEEPQKLYKIKITFEEIN